MRLAPRLLLILGAAANAFVLPAHHRHLHRPTTALKYLDNTPDLPPIQDPPSKPQQRPARRSFLHQLDRFLTELQDTQRHLSNHTFLSGNFRPVSKEHVSVPVQVVEGAIPHNLVGSFLRNGPNPIRDMERKKRYHWFDGHAMLHTLAFKDGKARYSNQFIPSPRYSIEQELGEEFFPNLGEYYGLLGLMKLSIHGELVKQKLEDTMTVAPPNTNIMLFNNKLYCLHEASLPMECRMHPDGRLEYVGYETFDGVLDYPVSAHPVIDGGDLLFHSYSVDQKLIKESGTMKMGRYNAATHSVQQYLVPTPTKSHVSFAHSLVHTENYMIVWDCSVHFSTDALFMGGSFFKQINDHTLKFGIVPKDATKGEDVIWLDSGEVGAIVHPLHAWEETVEECKDGKVVSSKKVIRLWSPFCEALNLALDKANTFHMKEFVLDPSSKTVASEVIDDTVNCEFSIMPPKTQGQGSVETSVVEALGSPAMQTSDETSRRYTSTLSIHDRYGYTAISGDDGTFIGYAKWDLVSRCLDSTVYYGERKIGGEPMVVRAESLVYDAAGVKEDAIYVGSYVYDEEENQSYFELYDGSMNERVCRLKMPSRVPYGFHGQWISGEELEGHFQYHDAKNSRFHAGCPVQWLRFFLRDHVLGH